MAWRSLRDPLFPFVRTLDRVLFAERPPTPRGPTMLIASDYGGTSSSSSYRIDVFVCADTYHSGGWEVERRDVRRRFLGDGRRMAYKSLSDRQRAEALVPFLSAARRISGLCLAFVMRKSIDGLCLPSAELPRLRQEAQLRARWKNRALADAVRVSHIVACIVGGMSQPNQNVYWISDEDTMFANSERAADLSRLLSTFTSYYVGHPLGELGIGTTVIDEGDRLEEDLAAVADLVAGGLAETTAELSKVCGGRIPTQVAVEYPKRLRPKAELISDWFWAPGGDLRRVAILAEQLDGRRYTVARHDMFSR